MTIYKIVRSIDKDCQGKNCEDILDRLVRPDGICRTCRNDHQYRPLKTRSLQSTSYLCYYKCCENRRSYKSR